MKIYIMVDIEGISGIFSQEQTAFRAPFWQEGRKFMTADVNACVKGCLEGGATEVLVRDCHGRANTLLRDELLHNVNYVQGKFANVRFPGIDNCSGIIFLGYHAMAGTRNGILDHTWSSQDIQNVWMNGKRSGEFAVDAAIAGEHNVPAVMVSGDDKLCAEARELIPDIITAEVKQGLAREGGCFLSQHKAHTLISAKACEAMGKIGSIKPFKVVSPVKYRVEMLHGNCPNPSGNKPYLKIIDARTCEVTGNTVEETFNRR